MRHIVIDSTVTAQPEKRVAQRAGARPADEEAGLALRISSEELAAWCRAEGIVYRRLNEPEMPRPEKLWHVLVYGAGRTALEKFSGAEVKHG